MAEKERELALALRKLPEARLELARRDRIEAFARAPSPSEMMHQSLGISFAPRDPDDLLRSEIVLSLERDNYCDLAAP